MTDKDYSTRLNVIDSMLRKFDPPLPERRICHGDVVPSIQPQSPPGPATVSQRFVVAPDPQCPRLSSDKVAESSQERAQAEHTLVENYKAIASYRASGGGADAVPVFINGDVVEQGDVANVDFVYGLIKSHLGSNAYVGLGNHDCDLPDYVFHGTRMTRSCYRHVAFMKDAGVSMDLKEFGSTDPFYQLYEGSLSYVVDKGDFRFIQVNNFPWFENQFKAYLAEHLETKEFKLRSSLEWLEGKLKEAADDARTIVIHLHQVPAGDQHSRFVALCEKYDVAAIFQGHWHAFSATWVGQVPLYVCNAGFYSSFAACEYHHDLKHLSVFDVTNNVVDRSKDYGRTTERAISTPVIGRIIRESDRFSVSVSNAPINARWVEMAVYVDGVELPAELHSPHLALYLAAGLSRSFKVKLRFVNHHGRRGPWTSVIDVPAYEGPLPDPTIPSGLRVEIGQSFRDSRLVWDAVPGAHGYVVKVAKGSDHLGGNVLTSLPPNCHEACWVSLAMLSASPETYRGMNFKVMTTTHQNQWSSPGLLGIDALIDHFARHPNAPRLYDGKTLNELLSKRDTLLESLTHIQHGIDVLAEDPPIRG